MTQIKQARAGVITPEMKVVARKEQMEVEQLAERVARGTVVIPANTRHKGLDPRGIGEGLTVKVNANIGTSSDHVAPEEELEKLRVSIEAGADSVMDLSTGGDMDEIRRSVLKASSVPIGTVPIYQAVVETVERDGGLVHMTVDDIFEVIERQALDGVDFITVHCGLTRGALEMLRAQGRVTDIVSRGGSFLTTWMLHHDRENPLYEHYDRLLAIAKKYDVTLSLGDGLRPGCLADATDRAQIHELMVLGHLTQAAWAEDVQVMIEGPGHVPLDQIEANVILQKRLCHNAPFYVLGPLVTDVATGYDHVACAIGGALAGWVGADFLCYVTPAEHLCLPSVEDVREGVVVTKIAAHAADIARGNPAALERDRRMAQARKNLDWETQMGLAIDPEKARRYRAANPPAEEDVCTMCGKYCAIKQVREYFGTS
ncbi:MAG: phosphomethylpyrimidine synthase ThiC [Deltaproteobacteria bacterium]|nr:phosphomethylpyrimidine synthase ThiC [Deltaproteobacteria bacterium]MBW1922238.1 phosphomethylpyrimidine synthase ThiC [Deltaproteobacteria bacterium]MBW1948618.1 phosphomethylpyrimidine synthase ThiC [Deltaproteobacteria bacterium]MBW2007789.1 phosphomethylpyrimidine synthase ThiC [Deltaproteobacteria bacterium]MBW2101062.1 phosphomethylpyrimidine synthase ThiC [Deltaproteobacteria bacterium]